MSTDAADDTEPAEPDDVVTDVHDWVSFDLDGFTWVFDVTFLLSNWTCIFLDGCPGVLTAPPPNWSTGAARTARTSPTRRTASGSRSSRGCTATSRRC